MARKQAPVRRRSGQWRKGTSGNPKGRPKRQQRTDAWQNSVTQLGTARDPRTGASYSSQVVMWPLARQLWRNNDLAARIVETHAVEALRRGIEIGLGEGMRDEEESIEKYLKDLPGPAFVGSGVVPVCIKALQYEAAYGGCAIWPIISGAQGALESELVESRITSVDRLAIFEPRQLRPVTYYADPMSPKFGEPAVYEVIPLAVRGGIYQFSELPLIHESRLIIFPGIRVSLEEQNGVEPGWGDNKLSRVYQVLADFDLSFAGAAALLSKYSQLVFKLKDLATARSTNEDFAAHLEAMNFAGSVLNALVVGSEDDVSRLGIPMAGLADALQALMLRLAAAADMPVSRLMGQAPAGLNATGESDTRWFYDTVEQLREHLRPMLEKLVRWCLLSSNGPTGGKLPDTWCVEYPPLWEPSKKEEIETRLMQAQIDKIEVEAGITTPEEVADSRHGGDEYDFDTQLDTAARAAQKSIVAPVSNQKPANPQNNNQEPAKGADGGVPPDKNRAGGY